MKNTIFVQIASYRDPQLLHTLNDMIVNAKSPENLHVTVCWQHGPDETLELFYKNGFIESTLPKRDISNLEINHSKIDGYHVLTRDGLILELIDIHYHKTQGACWARNTVQQFYTNEKYTLQLDSHHRFVKNWDDLCIIMLESVRNDKTPKPVLTAYIPSFDPERDHEYNPDKLEANDPNVRNPTPWKMDFDRFIPEGAVFFLPSTIDNWETLDKPVTSRFYSGHFCFADGSFSIDVQHDPEYFFHGEEISIAARAYTHGYDLFHPHRVVAWHEYTRKGRTKVWDDHTTGQKNKGRVELDWCERNNACHARNRVLFGMDGLDPKSIDFGRYGFGTVRSLHEYEQYAGISFKYRSVQQQTYNRSPNHHYPPNTYVYTTEEEWKKTLIRSNDMRILISISELKIPEIFGDETPDFDFFYVGCHDSEGKEIFRKDLQKDEINNYLTREYIDYQFIFMTDDHRTPVTYTVWTHSASKGWLTKIDRPCN